MRILLFEILILAVVTNDSFSADLFVNNLAGDDRNNGRAAQSVGGFDGPFRTISGALRSTHGGDRVIVANTGEVYRESITLQGVRQSGFATIPFELIGNGAILDGTCPVPLDGWSYFQGSVFRFRPPRTSYQLLFLNGRPADQRAVSSIEEIHELKPLEWCLYDRQIYFCVEPDRLPQAYDLSFTARRVGITIYEVHDAIVRDFVVQGFQLDGVNAHDGARRATLLGLNCRGNGRSGISIGGASRVRVESCLVGNNGAVQVRTEGHSRVQLVGCDLLDNTAPKIISAGGDVEVTQ